MMKVFKPAYLLAVCALITIVLNFSTCKKDAVKPVLTGIWYNDSKVGVGRQRETYQFGGDSSVLFTRTFYDTTSQQLLGYNYKMTGKYSFDGTILKMTQLSTYADLSTTPLPYTTLQALVSIKVATEQSVTLKLNDSNTGFNLIYAPCPANANCLSSSPLYLKQLPGIQ